MPEGPRKGLHQHLRKFTVQIQRIDVEDRPDTWETVGTGFLVSRGGEIVTCAHVVRDADVEPRVVHGKKVGVYFPKASSSKAYTATVHRCLSDFDDDAVVLVLEGEPPEEIEPAILGRPEPDDQRGFQSFGFRRLGNYQAGRACGLIMGDTEPPDEGQFRSDPLMLQSQHINSGMSGAPVLETRRDLIVGVITDTYVPDADLKDRDTGFGVSAAVLGLSELGLVLQDEPHELEPVEEPPTNVVPAASPIASSVGIGGNAPEDIGDDFVARDELLEALTQRWRNRVPGVVGLIGFGGEGKTSLARRCLSLLCDCDDETPDTVFWWTFHRSTGVEYFFEEAVRHVASPAVARAVTDTDTRARLLGELLTERRCLFILDGLEAVQRTDGDDYTDLEREALRKLLTYFDSSNAGMCVVTSRLPLLELERHALYRHVDLDHLTRSEGCALLRKLGVTGTDADLRAFVEAWNGHALTLSLLGAYAAEECGGDISAITAITAPAVGEPGQKHIGRVLSWYDERLSGEDQALLMQFSVFRKPVSLELLSCAAEDDLSPDSSVSELVRRLEKYRIVRETEGASRYMVHPLIRGHYYGRMQEPALVRSHRDAMNCYLEAITTAPEPTTLEDLSDTIEAVHHGCRAGDYADAYRLYRDRIDRGGGYLQYRLGAYEVDLALILEFYEGRDVAGRPLIDDDDAVVYLLRAAGLGLMTTGRLEEARAPFEVSFQRACARSDPDAAGRARQAASELLIYLGDFASARRSARAATEFYSEASGSREASQCLTSEAWGVQNTSLSARELSVTSLAYEGWAAHLSGDLASAGDLFERAVTLIQELDDRVAAPLDLWGTYYTDHLRQIGETRRARALTVENLAYAEANHVPDVQSQCHRILGDIDAEASPVSARRHYEKALELARSISHRPSLIEALVAWGRWDARRDEDGARAKLDEAREYARSGGYRVYTVDAELGLAWQALAEDDEPTATALAQAAETSAAAIGYSAGRRDAAELLGILKPIGMTSRSA